MMIEIRKRLMLATTGGSTNNKRRFDPVKQKPPDNDNSGYYYSALPYKRDADVSFDSHEDDSDSESVPRLMSPEDFMQPNQSSIHSCKSLSQIHTKLISHSSVFSALSGAKVCFIFSLSGCVFLGILSLLLSRPKYAMYLKAGAPHMALERSHSVASAGAMYALCAAVAAYFWLCRNQPALHMLLARQRDRVRSAAAGLED